MAVYEVHYDLSDRVGRRERLTILVTANSQLEAHSIAENKVKDKLASIGDERVFTGSKVVKVKS